MSVSIRNPVGIVLGVDAASELPCVTHWTARGAVSHSPAALTAPSRNPSPVSSGWFPKRACQAVKTSTCGLLPPFVCCAAMRMFGHSRRTIVGNSLGLFFPDAIGQTHQVRVCGHVLCAYVPCPLSLLLLFAIRAVDPSIFMPRAHVCVFCVVLHRVCPRYCSCEF